MSFDKEIMLSDDALDAAVGGDEMSQMPPYLEGKLCLLDYFNNTCFNFSVFVPKPGYENAPMKCVNCDNAQYWGNDFYCKVIP